MNVRVSPVPPLAPADWYGWTRPCKHCRGEIVRQRKGEVMVSHESHCPAVRDAKSKIP